MVTMERQVAKFKSTIIITNENQNTIETKVTMERLLTKG